MQMDKNSPGHWLVFEAETNNLTWSPDQANLPRLIRLSWVIADGNGQIQKSETRLIRPEGFRIARSIQLFMGLDEGQWQSEGKPVSLVVQEFVADINHSGALFCQNPNLEWAVIQAEAAKDGLEFPANLAVWSLPAFISAAMPKYTGSTLSQDFFRFLYGKPPEGNFLPINRVKTLAALLPSLPDS